MDDFQTNVKNALDDHVFNKLALSKDETIRFAEKIKKKSEKRLLTRKLSFVIPALTIVLMVIITGVLVKSLLLETGSVASSIEETSLEEFGRSVVVPEFKEYPIIFAAITKPDFIKEPLDLRISCGLDKGEMQQAFASNENRKKWEKEQESILLYGPYESEGGFIIEYRPGGMGMGDSGVEKREINGVQVQYNHFQRPAGEFVIALLNIDGGNYSVEMRISEHFTFSDSEEVLKDLTRQLTE